MTQYRLLARAELHGAIRDPGYLFTLAEGESGPHRTVVASNHGAQITDHMNAAEGLVDEPLYEEIKELPVTELVAEVDPISEEHARDKARIADLEAQLADSDRQLGEAHMRLAAIQSATHAPIDAVLGSLAKEDGIAEPKAKATV